MFLYLLHNSNLIEDGENKIVQLIIYGILLYIILHLITNSVFKSVPIFGYYFWVIFILDSISLSSILVRESNGQILVNNINNIKIPTEQNREEIIKNTKNLEELLKETNNIKKMVNNPVTDGIDSNEFNKFIEELNNSDSGQLVDKPQIKEEPKTDPKPVVNTTTQMDERDLLMETYKKSLGSKGSDITESNRENIIQAPPTIDMLQSMQPSDNHQTLDTLDTLDTLSSLDNSKPMNNLESDIDIDLNDFDKLIN